MIDEKDTSPADKDGKYEFQLHYSGREVPCLVEKNQNRISVQIEDNIFADLELLSDGTIKQTGGSELPDSAIDYIKKRILG